ncbi:MAG: hypothetical protein J6O71_01810 [Lachnospiraceae bacterium]|nr:hypothetical protein [Lachnospiraceae bacterium]
MELNADSLRAVKAKNDPGERNRFLQDNEQHILRLTGKITHSSVTRSDDEWAIALSAVNEAIDRYDSDRGDFWNLAAVLIKNRITDEYRRTSRYAERPVDPEAFDGNTNEESGDLAAELEVSDNSYVMPDSTLKDEIDALEEELKAYNISFFELEESSPKAVKTRNACAEVIKSIFLPPPLVQALKRLRKLPVKDIIKRSGISVKLIDKHRKYLVTSTLILDGDYPALSEYLGFIKNELKTRNTGFGG